MFVSDPSSRQDFLGVSRNILGKLFFDCFLIQLC